MTQLKKRVIRELAENWDHHGRHIVIEVTPPDLVSFRERGKSRKYTAKARWIMQKIIEHDFEEKTGGHPRRGLLGIGRHA